MPNYRIWPSAAEPSRARPAGASRAPRRARFNAGQSGGPSPRRCPGKSGKERTLLRPFLEFEKEKARSFRSWPGILAPRVGFEPTTLRLTAECSAVELPRNIGGASRPQRKIELYRSATGLQELFLLRCENSSHRPPDGSGTGAFRSRHRPGAASGISRAGLGRQPLRPLRRPGFRHRLLLPSRGPVAPGSSGGCGGCARNRGVWCSP